MKKMMLLISICLAITTLGSCAKYSLKGGGKAKKSEGVNPNSNLINGAPNGQLVLRATPDNTTTGTQITFSAQCLDNQNVSVQWSFADGSVANGLSVSHAYQTPNSYRVTAICTTPSGQTFTGEVPVTITAPLFNQYPPQNNWGDCCQCEC